MVILQPKTQLGKQPASALSVPRLPCVIGRSSKSQVRVDGPGVWDRHAELEVNSDAQIKVRALSDGLVLLNGEAVKEAPLRNGDVVGIGGVQLQFWLSEARQKSLGVRELWSWALLGVVVIAEVIIIADLLRY